MHRPGISTYKHTQPAHESGELTHAGLIGQIHSLWNVATEVSRQLALCSATRHDEMYIAVLRIQLLVKRISNQPGKLDIAGNRPGFGMRLTPPEGTPLLVQTVAPEVQTQQQRVCRYPLKQAIHPLDLGRSRHQIVSCAIRHAANDISNEPGGLLGTMQGVVLVTQTMGRATQLLKICLSASQMMQMQHQIRRYQTQLRSSLSNSSDRQGFPRNTSRAVTLIAITVRWAWGRICLIWRYAGVQNNVSPSRVGETVTMFMSVLCSWRAALVALQTTTQ